MVRDILVIGGTRFFGKKLVKRLIENGDCITVASRNLSKADFGTSVEVHSVEREDFHSLESALGNRDFDLIYDQICYSPLAADYLCRIFSKRAKQVIFTSSQSVYPTNALQKESDFNASDCQIRMGKRADFNYADGKRLAEAVYAQNTNFPVTAIRFPFVVGADDYMARLDFHIERIVQGSPIVTRTPTAKTSFINAEEAADFLFWAGQRQIHGPINACSLGDISLMDVIEKIETAAGKSAVLKATGPEADISPYEQTHSRFLDVSKARELGFKFSHLDEWLPDLINSRVNVFTQRT